MPTEAQITANRLNAQKSTGPKTPEGKAASSLNALKSGSDAWSHIIPGETHAELQALTAAFLAHFHPTDPIQLSLVDTLISTEWIQRRLRRIEAELWNYEVASLRDDIPQGSPLGHAYQAALDPFSRIARRIDATNRMYLRTLKALQDLQSAPATPISESPSPEPPQPLAPEIGFVPQSTRVPAEPPHARHENHETPLYIHSSGRLTGMFTSGLDRGLWRLATAR